MNGIRYVHTLNLTTNTATRDIIFDLKHIKPPLPHFSLTVRV